MCVCVHLTFHFYTPRIALASGAYVSCLFYPVYMHKPAHIHTRISNPSLIKFIFRVLSGGSKMRSERLINAIPNTFSIVCIPSAYIFANIFFNTIIHNLRVNIRISYGEQLKYRQHVTDACTIESRVHTNTFTHTNTCIRTLNTSIHVCIGAERER